LRKFRQLRQLPTSICELSRLTGCSVLQCVAVCCSVLQCVSQCVAACCTRICKIFRRTGCVRGEVFCSVLQRVTVCCNVLRCSAVCCTSICQLSLASWLACVLRCAAVCCTPTHCITQTLMQATTLVMGWLRLGNSLKS